MASITHLAIGMVAGRLYAGRSGDQGRAMLTFAALSMLPDADIVAFALRIPYEAPFGHRGASHSLVAALAAGVVAALVARALGLAVLRTFVTTTLVVASHGLLDTLTDGGCGVALLWPFSTERFFAPWRPIPVAPIGLAFFGERGLDVLKVEIPVCIPMALLALWPRGSAARASAARQATGG